MSRSKFNVICVLLTAAALPTAALADTASPPATLADSPAPIPASAADAAVTTPQVILASTSVPVARDPRGPIYSDSGAARSIGPNDAIPPEAPPAASTDPVSLLFGGLLAMFIIAWRRCQWAARRGNTVIDPGQALSGHPPREKHSPIGLGSGHGHLPFGG